MIKSMTTNLMVENVEETIHFYEKQLGFTVVASVPNEQGGLQFAILAKDEITLMAQERTNLIVEYPALTVTKVQPSVTLYIKIDDLEELYEKLTVKGLIYTEMHKTFYGANEFAILDNSGYVLTFTE